MTRSVRWSGLGLFVGLIALMAVLWWVFVDWMVEWAIEETGTEIVGARVDLDAADLSLFPAGLELTRLQVTNPSEPMTNAIEVARIAGGFDLVQALLGKTIVDELAVDGLRFGTPRQSSGAISSRRTTALAERAASEAADRFELLELELPDGDDLIAGAELRSAAMVDELQAEVEAERARWEARLAELPDQSDLDRYRERLDALKTQTESPGIGAIGAVGDATELVKGIRADVEALETATRGFEEELGGLKSRAKAIEEAKARDIAELRARYGLSANGLSNLTALLLGEKVESIVRQGFGWYERLRPFYDTVRPLASGEGEDEGPVVVERVRGSGVEVRFPEPAPLPGWLIRRSQVSVVVDAGEFGGEILDLTSEQPILGRPTTAHFASDGLEGMGPVRLDAVLDHVDPAASRDRVDARVESVKIEDVVLSPNAAWPIGLSSALADLDAKVTVVDGEVDAKLGMAVRQAALTTDFGESPVAGALASALESTKRFRIGVRAKGRVDGLDLAIESDLDTVLRDAVGGLLREHVAQLDGRLREQIDARVSDQQAALTADLKQLGGVEDQLRDRLKPARELLAEAVGGAKPELPGGFKLPGG